MMRRKLILLPAFLSMLAAAPGLAAESQPIKPAALHAEAKPQVQVVAGAVEALDEEKGLIKGQKIKIPRPCRHWRCIPKPPCPFRGCR